jgi:hypothetical protein
MDLTNITLVICLILAGFILGMIVMAILLHPYRGELKRMRQREAARRHHQNQLRSLDR